MPIENALNDPMGPGGAGEVEAALASLRPVGVKASRDALMFEAGRRSTRKPLFIWRSTAVVLAVLLAAMLVPVRPVVPRQEARDTPPPPVVSPPIVVEVHRAPQQFAYLELRSLVLRDGVDALPPSHGGDGTVIPTINSTQLQP